MRLLCAAAVSLSLGLWFVYAEDKKPADAPKSELAEKLSARKKKFQEEHKELTASLARAENPADQRAIQGEIKELVLITASKVLDLIEANPQDDVALDAAAFIVETCAKARATGDDVTKALKLIAEHHAANPKVKNLLLPAAGLGEASDRLLKAVAENNPDKDTKAVAGYLLAVKTVRQVEEEEDDAKAELLAKGAIDLLEKAAKEAPTAKVGAEPKSPTIGELAAKQIENLKAITSLAIGKTAPEVESLLLDGKKTKLTASKGKVVLLDIWATWCGPCVRMIPHERKLVESMKDKPFELISVSVDNKKETLEKFLETQKMPWTHWWQDGQENPVMKKYRVRAFPTLYVIDHTGVIKHKWVGSPRDEELDKAIDDLVKAAIKAKG